MKRFLIALLALLVPVTSFAAQVGGEQINRVWPFGVNAVGLVMTATSTHLYRPAYRVLDPRGGTSYEVRMNGQMYSTGAQVINLGGTSGTGVTAHANVALEVFRGSISGSSLYVATSLQGLGLTDCDTAGTSKVLWDATTGRFSCGSDASASYTAGNGLTLNGTSFRLNATVTGALVQAVTTLASSGTLVFEGAGSGASLYVATSLQGVGLTDCDAATQTLNWDATAGRFSCGTDSDTTYTAGQGLGLNGTAFSLNSTVTGALVRAVTTLASSGTLVFEGAASGSSLYLGTSLTGAGLTDCDTSTSALLWDTTTGRFSCDTTAGNQYTAGQGLTLNGTAFSLTAAHSGTVIKAATTLASSGSLTWEGAGSGATLYVGNNFQGAGLVDCDLDAQSVAWDATTGRFSCGDDDGTAYTAGQGLTLTSAVFKTNATLTGTLVEFTTVSGSTVYGQQSLRSSGSLVWEGAASGASLYLGGIATVQGLNCTSCIDATDLAATTVSANSYGSALNIPTYTVDADGRLTAASNTTIAGITGAHVTDDTFDFVDFQDTLDLDAALVLNSGGFTFTGNADGNAAGDFIWVGDTDANLFTVDASADRVGIGIAAPKTKLGVLGTISGSTVHADTSVRSSGSLLVEGIARIGRLISVPLCDGATSCATGSGGVIRIPKEMDNYVLSGATLDTSKTGTTGTISVNVWNTTDNTKFFTTEITIDSAETSSDTAATPVVLGTAAARTVSNGDILVPRISAIHTTPSKGTTLTLTFYPK